MSDDSMMFNVSKLIVNIQLTTILSHSLDYIFEQYKTWILDCGLDCGMDCGLISLEF